MSLEFNQQEVEGALSDAVPRGLRKEIATDTGIYPSTIYAYFNADDETKSPAFQLLRIACALDKKDAEVGESYWQTICRFREMSKPFSVSHLDLETETSRTIKEDADFVIAHVEGLSLYEQLAEADEAIQQWRRTREALLEAINKEKENGGRARLSTRQYAKTAVNNHRSKRCQTNTQNQN